MGNELLEVLERRQDEARKYRRAAIEAEASGFAPEAGSHALLSIAASLEALVAIAFELVARSDS